MTLNAAKDAFRAGSWVMVHDHHREEEGDLFLPASAATPEHINFLLHHVCGMINVAVSRDICSQKGFELMVRPTGNSSIYGTNFCTLVDAAHGISTGVSAFDRAKTIQLMADPNATPTDFVRPGHTAPIMALSPHERFGHTEASVELAKDAGITQAVLICEIITTSGHKATYAEQKTLAAQLKCPLITLEELHSVYVPQG